MIGYPEALALVIARARAMPVESVPINRALGQILAGDIVAPFPIPPFSSSAVDGYAVRVRDVAGATAGHPVTLRLAAEVQAGDFAPARLKPLQAFRIFTGAPADSSHSSPLRAEATTYAFAGKSSAQAGLFSGGEPLSPLPLSASWRLWVVVACACTANPV